MPKQYLPLRGQPIALYSLQTFAAMPEVGEVVVVCDPSYRDVFQGAKLARALPMKFALPGATQPRALRALARALRCARATALTRARALAHMSPAAPSRAGKERQDSVFNGLQAISASAALVAVHDSARPLVTQKGAPARHTTALRGAARAMRTLRPACACCTAR